MVEPNKIKQIAIAVASMAGGLALGFSISSRNGSETGRAGETTKGVSAANTSTSDALVAQMASLFDGGVLTPDVVQQFDKLDLAEAMRIVKRLDGRDWLSGAEAQTLQFAFSRWAELDPAGAVDWIIKPGHARVLSKNDFGLKLAFTRLAETDLAFALERFTTLEPEHRAAAVQALREPFAQQDPQAALAFFVEHKSYAGENTAFSVWAKTDPLGAIAAAENLPPSSNRSYVAIAVREWAFHDPEKAIAWAIESDLDPARKNYLFGRIAMNLAGSDPASSILALNQIPAGAMRQQFMMMFVQTWAQFDSESAIGWVRDLPDPVGRTEAIQRLVNQFSMSQPELALELGESLASSQQRDNAFATHAAARARTDADEALAWAEELEDPDRRLIAVQNSISVLAGREAKRAMEYVLATENEADKRSMMNHVIEHADFGEHQLPEMREVVDNMSRADERMTVDSLLEVQGDNIPGAVKLLMRTTGRLGPILDWMSLQE